MQIIVWLNNPKEAGVGALISIVTCTLTTGFTSALIAYDQDVDVEHRKNQPNFYGYIPDDHAAKGRCFFLMTMISALHNLSRSVGFALLSKAGKMTLWSVIIGEVVFYIVYKTMRNDFLYWPRVEGYLAFVISFFSRIVVKIVVDFSGCLQFRHP